MTDVDAVKRAIELVRQIPGPSFHRNTQASNAHHAALQSAVKALAALLDELQSK